jgi:hypothetical protein
MNGKYTKMEVVGNNILVIPQEEIEKVVPDEYVSYSKPSLSAPGVEVQSLLSFYGGSNNSGGFTILTGYRFRSGISTGGGVGVDWFSYQVMPAFADVTYIPLKGALTPFIYARGGYAVPLGKAPDSQGATTKSKGGILFGSGIGLRKNFRNHTSLVFSAGYRFQKLKTESTSSYWWGGYAGQTIERIDRINRIGITVGFLFN